MNAAIIEKMRKLENKGNQKLSKWITLRTLAIFLTIGYVISLVPLLWIAKFNYPSADDYTNGSRCYHVWEAEHSILKVLAEAFSRTIDEWLTWRGCFTSSFLSALPPNIWGEKLYFLTTWVVLLTLSLATVFFFYELLVKGFGANQYVSHSVSMITLFIMVQCMGESGRAESFYWYSGAINYAFIHGLSLFFYGMLISIANSGSRKKGVRVIVTSVLGFLVAGGNQMTMLNGAIVLMCVIALLTASGKWKDYKKIWIPIASFYVGFVLGVIAPGNFVRAGASSGMNPIKAIFVSFYYCLDLMINQWTTWSIILLVICMVPLFWYMAENVNFKFSYPFLVVMFGYCLVSAMATPPLFIMGNIEAGRIQGLIFLMYVPVLVLCVGYVTGWVRQRWEEVQENKKKSNRKKAGYWEIHSCQCLVGCVIFFLFGSLISVIPEPHFYTVTSAITDLRNDSAVTYGQELEERIKLYHSKAGESLIVEPLSMQPELLFFSDIEKDSQDWKNQGVCRYYDLGSVAVNESNIEFE